MDGPAAGGGHEQGDGRRRGDGGGREEELWYDELLQGGRKSPQKTITGIFYNSFEILTRTIIVHWSGDHRIAVEIQHYHHHHL